MGCGGSKIEDNSGSSVVDDSVRLVQKPPGITFNENGSGIVIRCDEWKTGFSGVDPKLINRLGISYIVEDTTNGDLIMTTDTGGDRNALTSPRIVDEEDNINRIDINIPPVKNHTYKLSVKVSVQYKFKKNGITYNPVEIYTITRTYGNNTPSVIKENRLVDSPEYSKMLDTIESNFIEGFISKSKYLPLDYSPYN